MFVSLCAIHVKSSQVNFIYTALYHKSQFASRSFTFCTAYPLSLDPQIGSGKIPQKKPFNREKWKKAHEEQQRRDLSPTMPRQELDVVCTE